MKVTYWKVGWGICQESLIDRAEV